MGKIGYGYGSEWHLLRYMGRHRNEFNTKILTAMGITANADIKWIDFEFGTELEPHKQDKEPTGLDFLKDKYSQVVTAWKTFWPQTGNPPNWDAVGWLIKDGTEELVLVEAKAHVDELKADCKASGSSITKISKALNQTKKLMGANAASNWTKNYYQTANRLAILSFLHQNGIITRLVFVYFTGDKRPDGYCCPKEDTEWDAAIRQQNQYLGLPTSHYLSNYIHKVFLPVNKQI